MAKPTSAAALDTAAEKYDRLLARFATSGFPALIIAVGLDDQLLHALDRYAAACSVLAVEPLPEAAHRAVAKPLWQSWMAAGRLTVLIGPEYKGYADAWRLISKDALQPPMIVDPSLLEKFPSQTEAAKAVAKQIVRGARANEDARKRFAGGYLINTLKNLPVIASEGDAGVLVDLFKNLPAIVVGAGPSLDTNLPALAVLQHCALILSVDTALRPLLTAGIRPHLVLSVDPSDANARHLNNLPDVRGFWLVAEGSLASSVFPQFAGRTFVYKVSNHDPWRWLAEQGADRTKLQTWGSVLTTAFDVALRAGCNPIVFAGADLAYTDGLQYCRNTIYEPDWNLFPTDAERAAEFARYLAAKPHLPHPDIDGREVVTAPHFLQFRDWLAAQAAAAAPRRIINGTGGGILYGAAIENLPLASIELPEIDDSDDDLRARLARAWTASTIGHQEIREQLMTAAAYGLPIPLKQWQQFAGDTTTLEQVRDTLQSAAAQLAADQRRADFLTRHRDSYDHRINTADDARELSHGNYDIALRRAPAQQAQVLLDFLMRTYEPRQSTLDEILDAVGAAPRAAIRALDIGCGAGRLMEAMVDAGVQVDGVDISERMVHFARQSPKLRESRFFVSRGDDCGEAPDGAYDLVYSQLCFRYIRSRRVRNDLLRAMARALRPGGVVVVELRFFRGLNASAVQAPHAPWSADYFDGRAEAGTADVCPTPDELHLLYDDFGRHFDDLRLQFVEVPPSARDRLPAQLYISGSIQGDLASRFHALPASGPNGRQR